MKSKAMNLYKVRYETVRGQGVQARETVWGSTHTRVRDLVWYWTREQVAEEVRDGVQWEVAEHLNTRLHAQN
jgi:hypothetical protein